MIITFLSFFTFSIGASFGSFVNVLADRTKKGESIFSKRSYCDHCKREIQWYDLIPIISYFLLLGRCRDCKQKLSIQYPVVETTAGLLALGAFVWQMSLTNFEISQIDWLSLVFYILSFTLLLSVLVTDIKYGLIYDRVVVWGIIIAFSFIFLNYIGGLLDLYLKLAEPANTFGKYLLKSDYFWQRLLFEAYPIGLTIIGATLLSLFFLLLVIVTKGRGMGGGDVKLALWLGLLTGMPNLLLMVFLSFFLGAIVAILLILTGIKKFGQTIPFGPFLVISAIITVIFGEQILHFYIHDFGFILF